MKKNACQLTTDRLILRPWQESDAETLYKYAKYPEIGPAAGWPPHTSVEDSLEVIRTVFSAPETYAVVLKETGEPVGSIGLLFGEGSHVAGILPGEAEIGYWIGKPHWGRGLIPEAVRCILHRCFTDLNIMGVWGAYYEGNTNSRRVMDKCGFRFHHTEEGKMSSLGNVRTEHFMKLTKEEWETGHHLSMRLLTKQDIPQMRALFRSTVLTVNSKDYTHEEVEKNDYIGIFDGQGNIIGFSSMNSEGHLHSMFVHKDWQHQGMASRMLAEVENMAREYGVPKIVVEASITARPFFEKHGYTAVKAQKAKANRLYLTNYVMEKTL